MIEVLGYTIPATLLKAAQVMGIIVAGLIITRLFGIATNRIARKPGTGRFAVKTTEYVLIIATIFASVWFLDPNITQALVQSFSQYTPIIISTILSLVLGVILVNVLMELLNALFTGIKLQEYLKNVGIDESLMKILLIGLRVFLYVIVLQISLTQLGIPTSVVESSLTAISYALAFLVIGLAFFATKDLAKNWLAGFYLKSSKFIERGQRIFVDDADGEVIGLSSFYTIADTGKGYYVAIPHSKLIEKEVRVKKSRFEIKTLESVRRHYVAQEKSFCVPAVLHIILTLFGYNVKGGQKSLAKACGTKVPGGTTTANAMKAVSKLTKNEVQGIVVPFKDILNLREEIKAWLTEGALVVVNFYKAALFPGTRPDQTHAVLCVGIEGDDLLIMDPNATTGGVYMVNYKDMEHAMAAFEGEERTYVAYAPRGTKAFWRIKNKLYYSDPVHYKQLSRALQRKLKQAFREASMITDVFPKYLREYMSEFKSAESKKIQRLWHPQGDTE